MSKRPRESRSSNLPSPTECRGLFRPSLRARDRAALRDAQLPRIATINGGDARFVGIRTAILRGGVTLPRDDAHGICATDAAKAGATIGAGGAGLCIRLAGGQRGPWALVGGLQLLAGYVERGVARVELAGMIDVDRRQPQFLARARPGVTPPRNLRRVVVRKRGLGASRRNGVAVRSAAGEDDPEIAADGHGHGRRLVVHTVLGGLAVRQIARAVRVAAVQRVELLHRAVQLRQSNLGVLRYGGR